MKFFFVLLLSVSAVAHAQFAKAHIQGVVTDSLGRPLNGVVVYVFFTGETLITQTDSLGFYTLSGIRVYSADMYFLKSGYIPQQVKPIYLTDQQVKQVNIVLHTQGHSTPFTISAGRVPLLEVTACELIGLKRTKKEVRRYRRHYRSLHK